MTAHFMRHYSLLAIRTCHRRGVHAMGGMAAQIPIRRDPAANEAALAKVRADKVREASDGHDGTWVAHPGLVSLARAVFDELMPGASQLDVIPEVEVTREDLLRVPLGTRTERGLRTNIDVGVRYLASWLGGDGCVPINDLMEDAATAEISRAQVWQWIRHPGGVLEDGRRVTVGLVRALMGEELAKLRAALGEEAFAAGHFQRASELFDQLATSETLADFLTLEAYDELE